MNDDGATAAPTEAQPLLRGGPRRNAIPTRRCALRQRTSARPAAGI